MKLQRPQPKLRPLPKSVEVTTSQITEQRQSNVFEIFPELSADELLDKINSGEVTYYPTLFKYAEALAVLYPEKIKQIDAKLWDELLYLSQQEHGQNLQNFCNIVTAQAMLYPDKKDNFDREKAWGWIFKERNLNAATDTRLEMFVTALLLYPERRAELPIDDSLWNQSLQTIEECRTAKNYWGMANICRLTALLFPEQRDAFNITDLELEEMKKAGESDTRSKVSLYQMAMSVAVITADKVSITDNGIILKHPEKPFNNIPNLPARNSVN